MGFPHRTEQPLSRVCRQDVRYHRFVTDEPKGSLQFDRAEFEQPPPARPTCASCGQAIWNVYYAVNGQVLCERCKTEVEIHASEGSPAGRFLRAAAYGIGAGAVGAAVWYGVAAATGLQVGIIAIVVGFLVGGAVRKGANGRGGWPYQALAVFLTYASIASARVPEIMTALRQAAEEDPLGRATPSLAYAIVFAFELPFLRGFEGIIGIFIIGIALYEAWKMNKKASLEITGPHVVGVAPEPRAVPLEPGRG